MNIIAIKGRICNQIEIKETQSGKTCCSPCVAVDRGYGENKQTDFFNVTFWNKSAEFVKKYFSVGQEIIIVGEMQSHKYQDKDGNDRISWQIGNAHAEFCGSKSDSNNEAITENSANNSFTVIEDEEGLPF